MENRNIQGTRELWIDGCCHGEGSNDFSILVVHVVVDAPRRQGLSCFVDGQPRISSFRGGVIDFPGGQCFSLLQDAAGDKIKHKRRKLLVS